MLFNLLRITLIGRIMERMPIPFMSPIHTNRFCDDMSYFVVFKTSFSIPPHNAAMSENEE